jgi:sugar lactone lactonase YvrE
MLDLEPLVDGLAFGEGPRWHDGRLWFSDMHAHRVCAVDESGNLETIVETAGPPSGLGWLPDGRLLVVSMEDRRLMRLDGGALVVAADLSAVATGPCNDMVVDERGRAYVGNFGFDLWTGGTPSPAVLVLVDPDGSFRAVADDMWFPNGSVITADGRTLIVAESFAARLTAFDIADDGSLSGRRVYAELGAATPDGICGDADGAMWVTSPTTKELLRVEEGGTVSHRVQREDLGFYACALGGADRRTLFVCTAPTSSPEDAKALRGGRIEVARADIPGAGIP